LSNEQIDLMGKFSVNLYDSAATLLGQRGDFTLEELLNFSFSQTYRNQQNPLNG